jgi:hypothetical protein
VADFLLASFYATMVAAGLIVELVFENLVLIPSKRSAKIVEAHVRSDYTTFLNIAFLGPASVLVWRYFRGGGGRAMPKIPESAAT